MFEPTELFRSVEIIWVIWLVSCIAVLWITVCGLSRVSWKRLVRLHRDEQGAAYALSYVMVVPIYFLFICLVVESSNILIAKVGTVYSAFAGARTAVVWDSAASPSDARDRITESARQAFVPFATGVKVGNDSPPSLSSRQREYLEAYEDYVTGRRVSRGNMQTKLANANEKLSVDYVPAADWKDDAEVKVTYQFRFYVPGIGHALGRRGSDGYFYYDIESSVRLQSETPQNGAGQMGISYASAN